LDGETEPSGEYRERRVLQTQFPTGTMRIRTEIARPTASRPPRGFRGSRRRLRRIKLRRTFTTELWLLIAWVVFLLLVVVPWMMRHSH
jgi:hypothetical protein